MEKKMTFNYFYGTEADQFSFYRIPGIFLRKAFQQLMRAPSVAKLSVNSCKSGLYASPRLSNVASMATYKASSFKFLFVRDVYKRQPHHSGRENSVTGKSDDSRHTGQSSIRKVLSARPL